MSQREDVQASLLASHGVDEVARRKVATSVRETVETGLKSVSCVHDDVATAASAVVLASDLRAPEDHPLMVLPARDDVDPEVVALAERFRAESHDPVADVAAAMKTAEADGERFAQDLARAFADQGNPIPVTSPSGRVYGPLDVIGRETEEDIPEGAPMEVNPATGKVRVARGYEGPPDANLGDVAPFCSDVCGHPLVTDTMAELSAANESAKAWENRQGWRGRLANVERLLSEFWNNGDAADDLMGEDWAKLQQALAEVRAMIDGDGE